MGQQIPSASIRENVAFNLCHIVPLALQGTFTRRRFWVGLLTRWQRDPGAVRFYQRLRKKYASDYVYVWLLTTRTLVVMDEGGVRHVLAHSPYAYADTKAKHDGMSHFQPGAVTISRGREWDHRRAFNNAVLDYARTVHRYAPDFLAMVRCEVAPTGGPAHVFQRWRDFDELFARIARQIIFGPRARDDREITDLLRELMRQANCPLRVKTRHFDRFYRKVRIYLGAAAPDSRTLGGLCGWGPQTQLTLTENQIPHWMFALWETLATNTVRALALIVSHPAVEQSVRQEMATADLATAEGINSLQYLEGCVQEAMRLWPTTPMLLRQVIEDETLSGEALPYNTQVLIPNTLHHRDRERYPLADTFAPEAWANGSPHPLFNHFGGGAQACAGRELALFLAKAVLTNLLASGHYTLERPPLDPRRPLPRAYNYFKVSFRFVPYRG